MAIEFISGKNLRVRTKGRKKPFPLRVVGRMRDKRRIAVDLSKRMENTVMAIFPGYLVPPRIREVDKAEEIFLKVSSDVSEDSSLIFERKMLRKLSGLEGIPKVIGQGKVRVNYWGYDYECLKDVFIRREAPFFVMPKVGGENLVDLAPRRWSERLPERKEIAFLATKVLPALAERLAGLHDENVVHRDVKPTNVIYNRKEGLLTLLDFGSANWLNAAKARTDLGTFGYFPPELIVRVPETEDIRLDVYGLGITCFTVLTGEEGVAYDVENYWQNIRERRHFFGSARIIEYYYKRLNKLGSLSSGELIKRNNMPAELKQTALGKYLQRLFHPNRLKRPYNTWKIAENLRKFGGQLAEQEIWS
jgi:serine/threonine protein kinase